MAQIVSQPISQKISSLKFIFKFRANLYLFWFAKLGCIQQLTLTKTRPHFVDKRQYIGKFWSFWIMIIWKLLSNIQSEPKHLRNVVLNKQFVIQYICRRFSFHSLAQKIRLTKEWWSRRMKRQPSLWSFFLRSKLGGEFNQSSSRLSLSMALALLLLLYKLL